MEHKDQFSLIQYHIISGIASVANVINLYLVRLEVRPHSCFPFYFDADFKYVARKAHLKTKILHATLRALNRMVLSN